MTADASGLERAQMLLMADRPEQALAELAALPAAVATTPVAYHLRAAALNALERWTEAARMARAGLEAAGPDPDLLGQLGRALRELGDRPGAERALLDALALAPDDVGLLCAYARLCMDVGQLEKAEQLVARAAARAPEAAQVYATRVWLAYALGRDAEAQRISRAFVAAYPESPVAHASLGGISAARGQMGQAYAGLRQAAAGAPTEHDLAEAAMMARSETHPLLWPVRPFERFGVVKPWLLVIVTVFALRAAGLFLVAGLVGLAWFALCLYSWTVAPLVRRHLRRRWRRMA